MAELGTSAVSVVVPVFAPGPYIRPLLDSLDAQRVPDGGFEAILVDDGSTDHTGALMDAWADSRPWATVVRLENSGWPSRPRNVGVAAARGEFVFFVDHDDWLAPDALARMTEFARATGADVVVGRMSGRGRSVPIQLFARTETDARAPETPLHTSMTVHAMFRRGFLDAESLEFDESLPRLEDHLFMATAYLKASRVGVLADADVYTHASRRDSANAGLQPYAPTAYYAALSKAIDVVLELRPPGPERDAYLARWLRKEMLERLRSVGVRTQSPEQRNAFFEQVQRILRDQMPLEVVRSLPAPLRWPGVLAARASADEFWGADDVIAESARMPQSDAPGSTVLRGVVSEDTLRECVDLLGDDEPLPGGTASTRGRDRRAKLLAHLGGGAQRRVVMWARNRSTLLRDIGVVFAVMTAVAAGALAAVPAAIAAVFFAASSVFTTAWLAVHSLSGAPAAVGQMLALSPVAVVAVTRGDAAAAAVALVGAALVVAAYALQRHWRRSDVRAYPAVIGGLASRLGWIGIGAGVVALVVTALDAWALFGR